MEHTLVFLTSPYSPSNMITPPPVPESPTTPAGTPTLVYLPSTWFLSEAVPNFCLTDELTAAGLNLNPEGAPAPISEEHAGFTPVMLPAGWEYTHSPHHGVYNSKNQLVARNLFPRNPDFSTEDHAKSKHPSEIKPCGLMFFPYMLRKIKSSDEL